MEIESLQQQVDAWIKQHGVRYFSPLTNMAMLTEEVGEVARIMARRYGEQSEKESDKDKNLGQELADVLFVCLCLANQTNTNLQEAFDQKLKIKTMRDQNRHLSNPKLLAKVPHVSLNDDIHIEISGSKSISNRLLILKHLYGDFGLNNLSNAEDTDLLGKALQENAAVADIHHAGTAMRFMTSYLAIQEGKITILTGSERMKNRPIKPLVEALQALGADITYAEKEGFPPLKIIGKKITTQNVTIPANISSQFITSLMLIGAKLEQGLNITLAGKITSLPYLEMSIGILNQIGIPACLDGQILKIPHSIPALAKDFVYPVESDWSSASYFYSFAAIGRKSISLSLFLQDSLQGDSRLAQLYQDFFGIETIFEDQKIILKPIANFVKPAHIVADLNDCPDIAQTLCVTAVAMGISFEFTGLETLKIKETDRLAALEAELKKIGAICQITNKSISYQEACPMAEPIYINTYNDHRMAMCFAPFALIAPLEFEDPMVVVKSFPNFWKDFYSLCSEVK
jgi:3-phosphoshikimate 1-carboxyvinyltransferase